MDNKYTQFVSLAWLLLSTSVIAQSISPESIETQEERSPDAHAQTDQYILPPIEFEGISVTGSWIGEYSSVVAGGMSHEDGFRDLLAIDFTLDLEAIAGLEHTTLFAQYQSINPSGAGSGTLNDFQGYSNIEIDRSLDAIYEFWVEHSIERWNLRIKIGKVDANSEFDGLDSASGFSNSSAGFSPTIFALPTYPDSAMSVNLIWNPTEQITLAYGLYDGSLAVDGVLTGGRGPASFFNDDRSNDWFHIASVNYDWKTGSATLGAWMHTGKFTAFDTTVRNGTAGVFSNIEHTVFVDPNSSRQINAFAQLGYANPDISEAELHAAFGMTLTAPFESRSNDQVGCYISHLKFTDHPAAGFANDETAIDFYYAIALHPNLTVRPEIQFVRYPSGSSTIQDATVIGGRVEFTF